MSGASEPRTWRDAIVLLQTLEARPVRTKGSHQTWRLPGGESFTIVCNHLGHDIGHGLRVKLRRLRDRRRGDDDPPHRSSVAGRWSFGYGGARLRRIIMSKNGNGGRGGNGNGGRGGSNNGNRGSAAGGGKQGGSTTPNLPSTTGNPSGGDRGNAPPSK